MLLIIGILETVRDTVLVKLGQSYVIGRLIIRQNIKNNFVVVCEFFYIILVLFSTFIVQISKTTKDIFDLNVDVLLLIVNNKRSKHMPLKTVELLFVPLKI